MEELDIIENLEWTFSFGKYENKTIREAIEESPSTFSEGVIDVYGAKNWEGISIVNSNSLISYLEWAEKENLLKISLKMWKHIKKYDHLFTEIENYKNSKQKCNE